MKPARHLSIFAAICATSAPLLSQGSDNCATAQSISGAGPFAFNTTAATTGSQGQANAICNQSGQTGIAFDVWYTWTASATGAFAVETCGQAGGRDTKIAVYSGTSCPAAAAIACNDDSCSLESSATFSATSGNLYTIQLGTFPGVAGGTGTFTISVTTPTNCGASTGPDVIVGDINGVDNATAAGGLDAISLGTTSCNIGTVWLNWISGTNQHPAIGGAVYRYKVTSGAGRFEQLGLSWLKHGFFALSGTLCCSCIATDGTHLGVGCSDPYSAARNGSQSGLGPRWQVNAHTGAFPYPPANPAWTGSVARRCQMLVSDIDVTARYFGESMYVTPDDAAAGNQNNNASYRELSVSGAGDFTFGMLGATARATSAIRAWKAIDPAVTLVDLQVPSDGLLVLGSRATSLGGGQYHYEYAVYNMNADRNAGSFAVPVSAGVTLTNIGFHDVSYHDGDGSGSVNEAATDWPATQGGGAITWACETQAQNANANAIRWGSTYNFRFDANAPPQTGMATVGLWKTGAPASMSANVDVPGGSPFSVFCPGDGTGSACPCANSGSSGHGCANSAFAAGALLAATGSASVAADTVVLNATSMTGATCVFFQGSASMAPVIVDDGLGCTTGSVIRLGTKAISTNASAYPNGADPLISVRGLVPGAGGTFYYQCFYRNAATAFCPPATSNRTNGVAIAWGP